MSKSDRIAAPRGMPDSLPGDMPVLRLIEETAHRVFQRYGYEEIRTPLFEETRLFVRGIGEATDIVEKEMYTFAEQDGSLTLRPEATASVVRAVVEHDLLKQKGFWKLYYVGPMFRKERPQAGRLRQFMQVGCEALGSLEPVVDAESVLLAVRFFHEIGLDGVRVKLNSIGCPNCRARYRNVLRELFGPKRNTLCPDCQSRMDRNIFRVLDCKDASCRGLAKLAPPMREHLDAECGAHLDAVLRLLADAGLKFELDDRLVRGFDYYTRTVFELTHPSLGARDAVCGGGRYDNLVEELGGPPAGCAGFAVGVVPTILALKKTGAGPAYAGPGVAVYVVAVNDEVRHDCFRIAERLRAAGISADLDAERRSLKAQMRSADKLNAGHVLVVGPDELSCGQFKLKEMAGGEEFTSSLDGLINKLSGTED